VPQQPGAAPLAAGFGRVAVLKTRKRHRFSE
jgi:hypothetical protein